MQASMVCRIGLECVLKGLQPSRTLPPRLRGAASMHLSRHERHCGQDFARDEPERCRTRRIWRKLAVLTGRALLGARPMVREACHNQALSRLRTLRLCSAWGQVHPNGNVHAAARHADCRLNSPRHLGAPNHPQPRRSPPDLSSPGASARRGRLRWNPNPGKVGSRIRAARRMAGRGTLRDSGLYAAAHDHIADNRLQVPVDI